MVLYYVFKTKLINTNKTIHKYRVLLECVNKLYNIDLDTDNLNDCFTHVIKLIHKCNEHSRRDSIVTDSESSSESDNDNSNDITSESDSGPDIDPLIKQPYGLNGITTESMCEENTELNKTNSKLKTIVEEHDRPMCEENTDSKCEAEGVQLRPRHRLRNTKETMYGFDREYLSYYSPDNRNRKIRGKYEWKMD